MRIVLFGANGPTGRLLTEQALAEGHEVTAVTRHPDAFPLRHERLVVQAADVFDSASVDQLVAGHDVVISSLGVPYSLKEVTLYSAGTANIVKGMRRSGVRRLVCVSSSGADPEIRFHDTGGGFFFEKVLKPAVILTIGRTVYADLYRMEQLIASSGLDWTIVRPAALFFTDTVTDYQTAEATISGRYTSRRDLADCLLRQLDSRDSVGKTLAIATFDQQPTMLQVFRNEALQAVGTPTRARE